MTEYRVTIVVTLLGLVTQPLSVYFTAVREEAYVGGGEEYLTFSSCPVNSGSAMDHKSGIFTVPVTGEQDTTSDNDISSHVTIFRLLSVLAACVHTRYEESSGCHQKKWC